MICDFNVIHNICITGLTHAVPIEHHQFIGCLSSLKYRELIEVTWEVSPTIVMQATPGCVDLCQENNPCGEGRCVNLYSSIHCDCFSVGREGDRCQYSSKFLVQLSTIQMKCQKVTILISFWMWFVMFYKSILYVLFQTTVKRCWCQFKVDFVIGMYALIVFYCMILSSYFSTLIDWLHLFKLY